MKTLQILPSLEIGGVERGVIDIARAAKARGEEMVVVSSGGSLVAELNKSGVAHYELPVHKKSLFSFALVPRLVEIIQNERIEVVHARSRVPAWLAYFACRKAQIPLVTTCHGYYSAHFLSRIMGWGKRVIVISRVVGRHMIDDFGVSPERIRLIHRGIDLSQFRFQPDKYDQPAQTYKIINVGRLSPIKGQVEFLKAIHKLREDISQIEVWLVGSEVKGKKKYTEQIEATMKKLGLNVCVKLLGTRRDIPELLAQTDLLVLGTLIPEAFGRVLVEAGAVGTAVLTTRVGGVLDVVDDDENGIFVPPGDIDAMAKAMKDLLLDRRKCKRLALNLRKKVEENFSLEQMFEKTFCVYNEAAHDKKILVIKLGAMGDVVLITPSLRMIRKEFPKAFVSLLVDRKYSGLVSNCPYVNEVIPVDRSRLSNPFYLMRLAKKMRNEGFDVCVDFQNSKWTHVFAYLAAITERYGFKRGKLGFLLNRPVNIPTVVEEPVKHQFHMLRRLKIKKMDEKLELWPDKDVGEKFSEMMPEFFADSGTLFVGFVLGSSPKWESKRWPLENFCSLARQLIKEVPCKIVLLGSSEDGSLATEFCKEIDDSVFDLVGKTSPKELVFIMSRLNILVTGDTAPLHVAAAADIPIVALFGPTDPRRHMPPTEKAKVYVRHIACQPCYQGVCRNEEKLECLKKISVEDVLGSIKKKLHDHPLVLAKN